MTVNYGAGQDEGRESKQGKGTREKDGGGEYGPHLQLRSFPC